MCGIAGAIGKIDRTVLAAVDAMSEVLVHRGPDADGSWRSVDGATGLGIALAHRRLKILDLSEDANQPMVDDRTGNVLIFNGEIYNYAELRRELADQGVEFRTRSDSEVLLRAFGEWGEACFARVRGMFALALWSPGTRRLTLVRDRFGIKPLYLCEVARDGGRTLFFASEVRALLATGLVERSIDPIGLASYVWNGFVCGPDTIVAGIRSLPARTVSTIACTEQLEQRSHAYWSFPSPGSRPRTLHDLRDSLEDSLRVHLLSDVPLGVFLSGGIDSSAVAAVAARVSDDPIHTFHISFDEGEYDESEYAETVARGIGADHTDIRLTQAGFRRDLQAALDSLDQPTFDAINTFFVSRAVREAGMTVALAGTGGDELFGGYTSFTDLPRTRRFSRLMNLLPGSTASACARIAMRLRTRSDHAIPPQTRWGKLVDIVATRGGIPELYQVQYGLFTREFANELLGEPPSGFRWGRRTEALDELREAVRGSPVQHGVSVLEFRTFLEERLLRDTDAASMKSSLEVRVPLIDHELLATVVGLPHHVRFDRRRAKRALLRAAMPEHMLALFDRPKSGFVLPIEAWCRSELGVQVAELLYDRRLCESVGLNPDAVARLWTAFEQRAPGIYWSRVWSLFTLMWWCRRHGLAASESPASGVRDEHVSDTAVSVPGD